MENSKIRVAFIKFGGMTIGGSELWLQKISANLPKDIMEIDYYYCDDSAYIGANHTISPSSPERVEYLKQNGVNVIKFKVGAKNTNTLTHDWVDTDFWEKFDESKYDLIQTVKAGPREYPYYKLKKPVVEIVGLANRPDTSKNIAWSFHSSGWQRSQWVRLGGSIEKSSVLTAPVEIPLSNENYREELGIPMDAIVAGFHQRDDNQIASSIPLDAFSRLQSKYPNESANWHFIIKNGGSFYREQAKELKLKNIHFLGATPDSESVSKFLNTLDIFAHGRKDGETFGAVFVEAMLHGKPCLSHYSPDGANAQPETMGPAGVFAQNLEEYEILLKKLFSNSTYRNHLAQKAKPHAQKYYSMDKCLYQILKIYEKLTGKDWSHALSRYDKNPNSAIPYGYSDMGFLYAGDMNKSYNIAYYVLVGGIPEAFDVSIVRSLLPYTKHFFDIGTNTGIYCWLAAQYYSTSNLAGAKVFAFEPQKDCFQILNATSSLNNWEDLVSVNNLGLGDKIEKAILHLSGTGSSLSSDFAGQNLPTQEIEISTLDHFFKSNKIHSADLIKIDVEGFEYGVLKGGHETICREKPILFIEIANKIHGKNYINKDYTDTLKWLFDRGYRIWISKNNRLTEIGPYYKASKLAMYLCLHKEKHLGLDREVEKRAREYRAKNLLLGLFEKRIIIKAIHKIVPKYITFKKVSAYLKRYFGKR